MIIDLATGGYAVLNFVFHLKYCAEYNLKYGIAAFAERHPVECSSYFISSL